MASADLADVVRVADAVHPDHPEASAIFAERLALFPAGCFVLPECGYALSHPWRFGHPPGLDTALGALPPAPDTLYLHDVALLPAHRRAGHGATLLDRLAELAARLALPTLSLTAVGDAHAFWRRHGFTAVHDPAIAARLTGYGPGAAYLARRLTPPAPPR